MLGAILILPHRDEIISNMPDQFKSEFPRTFANVDCTELKTQKLSSLKLQLLMYSDYKSGTTLKGLMACDPIGNAAPIPLYLESTAPLPYFIPDDTRIGATRCYNSCRIIYVPLCAVPSLRSVVFYQ